MDRFIWYAEIEVAADDKDAAVEVLRRNIYADRRPIPSTITKLDEQGIATDAWLVTISPPGTTETPLEETR